MTTGESTPTNRLKSRFLNPEKRNKIIDAFLTNNLIHNIALEDFETSISLVAVLVSSKLAESNSDAIRLIKQNAITINEVKCSNHKKLLNERDLVIGGKSLLIRKGKKDFILILAKCSTCTNISNCKICKESVGECCFIDGLGVCCSCMNLAVINL